MIAGQGCGRGRRSWIGRVVSNAVPRAVRPVVEELEGRRLLSGSVSFGGGGGVDVDELLAGTSDSSIDVATAVAIDGDTLVVAGSQIQGQDVLVARFVRQVGGGPYLPDANFGDGGVVTVDFGGSGDRALDVAIDGSGNIYVAGGTDKLNDSPDGVDQDMAVAKLSAGGTVMWVAGTANAAADDAATSVAVTAAGVTIGGWGLTQDSSSTNLVLGQFDSATGAAAGFGVVVEPGEAGDDQLHDVLVDGDGNVYAGGSAGGGFLVAKYDAAGTRSWRDQSQFVGEARITSLAFDGARVIAVGNLTLDGIVAIAGYNPPDGTQAITPFTDGDTTGLVVLGGEVVGGEVVVAGISADQTALFAVRYDITPTEILDAASVPTIANPLGGCTLASIDAGGRVAYSGHIVDGLDLDFGATIVDSTTDPLTELGTVQHDFSGANFDEARALAVDVADRTYVAGYKLSLGGARTGVVARFTSAGALDTTFDDDGIFEVGASRFDSIVLDEANGFIYVGAVTAGGPIVVQLDLATGALNWATSLGAPAFDGSAPTRVALGGGGELIVAATTHVGSQDDLVVTSLVPANGLPIWSTITDVGTSSNDAAGALLIQGSNVLVGGSVDGDFLLARYNLTTGALQGSDVHDLGGLDVINGLAAQSDGRIIAAGRSDGQMAVAGYTALGVFDGLSVELAIPTFQGAQAIAVDDQDRILLAGTLMSSDDDFLVVRLTDAGAIDTSFGDDGQIAHDFGIPGGNDAAFAILLDGADILVAGSGDVPTQFADFAVARINPTGGGGGGGGDDILTISGDDNATPNNVISLSLGADGNYHITIDGQAFDPIPSASVQQIVINAGAGNDIVLVGPSVSLGVEIHGGGGNDALTGGAGDDLLFGEGDNDLLIGFGGNDVFIGGAGSDLLTGGSGRDVLIGGANADLILGSAADDILIAGTTAHDTSPAALGQIRVIWRDPAPSATYAARVAALGVALLVTAGSGATVFDDGAVDLLSGSSGQDWFLFNNDLGVRDLLIDGRPGEIREDIDFPIPIPP